jgi:hypothetical protein
MTPFRSVSLVLLVSLLSACGELAETTARPPEKDAAAGSSVPETFDAAPADAQAQPPSLFEDSAVTVTLPPEEDAGPSPCVAAGGTCLELIACDGVGVDLACGWSASCCMPVAPDGGACPPNSPTPGAPCDVSPAVLCGYPPCHDAWCESDGGDGGTWVVGPDCSPPPPGG